MCVLCRSEVASVPGFCAGCQPTRPVERIKWRLLPRLARSVGFAPICGPQKLPARNNYQQPRGTSRSGHQEKANSATRSESGPKFRHAANRVNAANKSFQNRNPIVSGQHPPGNATSEYEQNTCEESSVGYTWSTTLRPRRLSWEKRSD